MPAIFISYRRADSAGYAGRIFDRLRREFGDGEVFRDVDHIDGGTRFPEEIARQLEGCRVFVAVIGPGWTDARNDRGSRRLDDPQDWVRIELATALGRKICVIPVTVGGASLPERAQLPGDLQPLLHWQRRDLRDGDTWEGDLDLLVRRIARETGRGNLWRRRAALAGIATVLAGGGWFFLSRDAKEDSQSEVTVQLWNVEGDSQGAIFASRQFERAARPRMQQIAAWVTEEIGRSYDLKLPNVQAHVRVPKDLRREEVQIEMTPPGAFRAYIQAVRGGQKSRIVLNSDFLASWEKDFHLEIQRPGYEPKIVPVVWNQEAATTLELQPKPVAIGIREFDGEPNSVATALSHHLAANPRFSIKDPAALKALHEELKKERELIAAHPAAQMAIRTSLGLDIIITGRQAK